MTRVEDLMAATLGRVLPGPVRKLLRAAADRSDLTSVMSFLKDTSLGITFGQRLRIVRHLYRVQLFVPCPHRQEEILTYIRAILCLPRDLRGVLVEAGCFKGGSTAKLSLVAEMTGRRLVVFDSFQGIPANEEPRQWNIFGTNVGFARGEYCGGLDEVRANVARYGCIRCCDFVAGWFDETMPSFQEPVAAAFLDVDLASSTRTCIRHLYPLLQPKGVLCSHDGHLPLVMEVFEDADFWRDEVGVPQPTVGGLRETKVLTVVKEAVSQTSPSGSLTAGA